MSENGWRESARAAGPLVVHVSTVHRWDDNRILRRECRSLARAGFTTTLVAVGDQPRLVDGVSVRPIPARRRWARILLGVPHAGWLAIGYRAGVYHLHDPELAALIPLLRQRGAKVIYDAHEDLPVQVLDKGYLPAVTRRAVASCARVLCWFIDRASDHVVAATPKIAERFDPEHTTVLPNYPELGDLAGIEPPPRSAPARAVYLGGISAARGAVQLVDAIALVPREQAGDLLLIGPCGPAGLLDQLRARPGWARVDHRGPLPAPAAWALMSQATVGLVVFQPTRAHLDALPNKLFEYLAAGLPVIASDFPAWRPIVAGARCGLLVDPTDPTAIAAALRSLAADPDQARQMGERGRRAVRDRYNWAGQERVITGLYRSLAGPGAPRSPGSPRDGRAVPGG